MKRGILDPGVLQRLIYQALDGSDDLILVLERIDDGADGLVVAAANDAFCRASDHTSADLVGKPFHALAAPEADPATWKAAAQSTDDGQSFRSQLLCNRPNGTSFWLGLHIMPVAKTTPPCSVLLGRDISETLRDQQQHSAIQGLLAKVFTSVKAAVAIVEEHGVIAMTNPAFDRLLGYSPGDLAGRASVALAAPEMRSAMLKARERQIASGEDYTMETSVLHADGSAIRVDFSSILVQREDLKRFRITTLTPLASHTAPLPPVLHIAGKIKLIGLEDIRDSLGARWPAVAARAMQTAEHIVKRSCGPRDAWSRTDDSGFVIIFGDLTEEEATLRATAIARDIRARLIGEGEQSSTARVSAITGTVDLSDQPGRPLDMLAAAIDRRLNERLAEIEGRARATLVEAINVATCKLSPVRSRHQLEIIGHLATLPHSLEQRVQSALLALPSKEREVFDSDRLVLRAAAGTLIEKIAAGSSQPVFVPVDFEIFLDRHCTDRYIAACQALDRRLQQNLVLVISHLPHGVPKTRVLDCAMRLRPFCQMMAFQTEELNPPPVEYSVLSGSIVMLEEKVLNRWSPDDLTRLQALIDLLHAQRARILVREVSSLANAKRLLQLGVDLISLADEGGPR